MAGHSLDCQSRQQAPGIDVGYGPYRDFADRNVDQIFGAFWSIGHSLTLIGIFVFIFSYVFKLLVGGTFDLTLDIFNLLAFGSSTLTVFEGIHAEMLELIAF